MTLTQARRLEPTVADDLASSKIAPMRLNGVTPARQARSERTFHALIRAGRKALEKRSFDAVTISKFVRTVGTSVGAFYGRFENKEAFFFAIQEITIAEIGADLRTYFTKPEIEEADNVAFLKAIAYCWVRVFRVHRGLYLAASKHSSTYPGAWTPFKRLGGNSAALIVEKLSPRLKKLGISDPEREIRVALQFVNSLLVNATLNDPGPIRLDDKEMEENITRFLCSFFGVDDAPASNRTKPRKKRIRK